MKKKKLTNLGKGLIALLVIAICVVIALIWKPWATQPSNPTTGPASTPAASAETSGLEYTEQMRKDYDERLAVNPDYVGELRFENGLVVENVVQGEDNEKYLDIGWDGQANYLGSAFLDYRNTPEDQNLIIYGHNVYTDETLMFSPLHQLEQQQNYEDNKYFDYITDGEIRRYLVTDVFYYEMDNESLMYYFTGYAEDYFKVYMDAVHEKEFYSTGETLSYTDNWMTLQTCIHGRDDLRLIIIGREVDRGFEQ